MKTSHKRMVVFLFLSLLVLTMTGCLCCLPTARRVTQAKATPTPERPTVITEPVATPTALPDAVISSADAEELLLVNIYKRVNPSVVHIRATSLMDTEGMPVPEGEPFYEQGTGSGFVYDTEGHIVTNNHVVSGSEELQVSFPDGTTVAARVVGTDPDSDLAVIRVELASGKLAPLELGNSDELEVGQRAIAIGNPHGLRSTLTTGIISALGRSLPLGRLSEAIGSRFTIPELIQTDAAINPGNSGGPLLNSRGQVIGVNTAYDPDAFGVGFAVPVNMVKRVVPKLIADGKYTYPWLGISGTDLSLDYVEAMNLPVTQGAIVLSVVEGSPADKAGLKGSDETVRKMGRDLPVGGDVIIAIDDEPVRQFEDVLVYILRYAEVEQRVRLTIVRDGREQVVSVTLAPRPAD